MWIHLVTTLHHSYLMASVQQKHKSDKTVLHNAVGGGRVSDFPEKSVTKKYGSTLLVLRGGGWVSNFRGESVT